MRSSRVDSRLVPVDVSVDDEFIRVRFSGGLEIATPVAFSGRLQTAAPELRRDWRVIGKGDGIHWPDVDEDLTVRGLIANATEQRQSKVPEVA